MYECGQEQAQCGDSRVGDRGIDGQVTDLAVIWLYIYRPH